ncbi:NAD dependent epimerase/dehydratase family protein [Candidatus Tiddalikarchaeum anstoanum]|nr:NAD dependent epimerase/dehydratase family protein [Candidatus Tiddalikarchaeum anstoanum]
MKTGRNVLILGGGGFIGYHAVNAFLKKGYKVTVLDLFPPKEGFFKKEVNVIIKDISKLNETDAIRLLSGYHVVVFAGGADDRLLPKKPAYDFFYNANVKTASNFFKIAKKAGVKKGILLSSYFAHFARIWPELKLAEKHPYIKSRIEQEESCLKEAGKDFTLVILELPYIFGLAPGKKPLWTPLIKYFKNAPIIFYTGGGTCMVSVKSVGEAIVGAAKFVNRSETFVVSDENLAWTDFIKKILNIMNQKKIIITIPNFLIKTGMFFLKLWHDINGLESGLNPVSFVELQSKNTFVDSDSVKKVLKYEVGNLDESLKEVVDYSIKI